MKRIVLTSLVLSSLSAVSQAGLLFGTSFEASEGYHLGSIGGQNGWLAHSTGIIDDSTAGDGTQSLSSSDHFSNGSFGNPGVPLWTGMGDARNLFVSFQGCFDSRWLDLDPGRIHGMQAELYFAATSLYPQVRFGVVDEGGATKLRFDAVASNYWGGSREVDISLNPDQWYTFTMVYNQITGRIGLGVDDKLVGLFDTDPNVPGYSNLSVIGFNSYYNNMTNGYDWEGKAWVDTFLVGTLPNPVPEPASMAVLGFGAAALIRRRKK